MRSRYSPLLLFSLLAALMLSFAGALAAAPPLVSSHRVQDVTITLTDSGFSPSVVTISVGSTVTWQNQSSLSYTLQSGAPYEALLPVMVRPSGLLRQQGFRPSHLKAEEPFNGTLAPGGTFSHQFTSAGEIFYHLAEAREHSGRIIVVGTQGTATPTTSVTATTTRAVSATASPTTLMGTQTPSVTATRTATGATATPTVTRSPTATGSVPTATATTVTAATNTPTMTATGTVPTATATATATATTVTAATNTPTVTATATATTVAATNTPTVTATGTVPTSTPTPTPTVTTVPLLSSWIINTSELSAYIRSNGSGVLVNVQSVESTTVNGVQYAYMTTEGIPNYLHTMTTIDIQTLNSRPKASTNFVNGSSTTATVGQEVGFGEDIGYKSTAAGGNSCAVGEGYGYWPPGPSCPKPQAYTEYFPLTPVPASTTCSTNLGAIGFWVNGSVIANWEDGASYNNGGIWNNVAPKLEYYDFDICSGHATSSGEYHHHTYPNCLTEQLGDTGSGHSPIYGFGADGYPIYGPWHASGQLAQSCWKTREYTATSDTGCGAENERSCLLKDQYDITQGITPTIAGPDTTATVTSLSSNTFLAVSGLYFEDYYYDSSCTVSESAYLDEHNGHEHDGLGYHYHVTVTQDENGTMTGVFPYMIGPTFYGRVRPNSFFHCNAPLSTLRLPHTEHIHEHQR